jgi:hypothetical protein
MYLLIGIRSITIATTTLPLVAELGVREGAEQGKDA